MITRLVHWLRRWRKPHWYDLAEGDYLDLRPRLPIGRHKWL